MKKIYLLIFLILFANCGKPNYPKIDASFERFDTSLLKYIDNHGNFLPDGSYIDIRRGTTEKGEIYYIYNRIPKNSYYMIKKIYYPNGNIAQKSITLNVDQGGNFGIAYFFFENGELEKSENYDLIWTFTINKVLTFCKRKGIKNISRGAINYTLPKGRSEIHQMSLNEKPLWFIEWRKSKYIAELFLIDGKTGEILKHEYGRWGY